MNNNCQGKEIYGSALYNKLLNSCKYLLDNSVLNNQEYESCKELVNKYPIDYDQGMELRKYTGGKTDVKKLEFDVKKNEFRRLFRNKLQLWKVAVRNSLNHPDNTSFKELAESRERDVKLVLQNLRNYILRVTDEYSNRDNTTQYNDLISKYKIIEKFKKEDNSINIKIKESDQKNIVYDKKLQKLHNKVYLILVIIGLIVIGIVILIFLIIKKKPVKK